MRTTPAVGIQTCSWDLMVNRSDQAAESPVRQANTLTTLTSLADRLPNFDNTSLAALKALTIGPVVWPHPKVCSPYKGRKSFQLSFLQVHFARISHGDTRFTGLRR